jgi:CheY-like chemotaxis protein
MLTRPQFLDSLRGALSHLYDPDYLNRCALAEVFGVAGRYDSAAAMRRILTEAVEALEPAPSEPPQSRAWRIYYTLVYLYIEQATQEEAADQLAISPRQLRREQRAALEQLADRLWEQFGLGARELRPDGDNPMAFSALSEDAAGASIALDHELAWLRDGSAATQTLDEMLSAVLALAERLAAQHGTRLDTQIAEGASPALAVHPVAFRQVLLNLLSVAIPRAAGASVRISVRRVRWETEVRIACAPDPAGAKPALADETASLNLAQRLIALSGGRLVLEVDTRAFNAAAYFPALGQLPVLVIDDSADTLALLQRYVSGTRYRLIPTQDPQQALSLAEQHAPQIIVLDVMMPALDGWEVLSHLRQHPRTADLPIVICTILAQKDLALLLGASDFVRKPVTQQSFLAALDRQAELLTAKEPR